MKEIKMDDNLKKDLKIERDRIDAVIAAATWSLHNIDSEDDRAVIALHRSRLARARALIDLLVGTTAGEIGYTDRFYLAAKRRMPRTQFNNLCQAAAAGNSLIRSTQGDGQDLIAANCGVGDLLSDLSITSIFSVIEQTKTKAKGWKKLR